MAFGKGIQFDAVSIKKRIMVQEERDYQKACEVLIMEYKGYHKNQTFEKMPDYCHYDMTYTFELEGMKYRWAIEIKEDKRDRAYSLLTQRKYNKVKRATNGFRAFDRVIYLSLVANKFAVLYDLKTLPKSVMVLEMREQLLVNYDSSKGKADIATYYLGHELGKCIEGIEDSRVKANKKIWEELNALY